MICLAVPSIGIPRYNKHKVTLRPCSCQKSCSPTRKRCAKGDLKPIVIFILAYLAKIIERVISKLCCDCEERNFVDRGDDWQCAQTAVVVQTVGYEDYETNRQRNKQVHSFTICVRTKELTCMGNGEPYY